MFVSSDVKTDSLYPQKLMQSKELLIFVSLCENDAFYLLVDYIFITLILHLFYCLSHMHY
jgi:hypothetical protein